MCTYFPNLHNVIGSLYRPHNRIYLLFSAYSDICIKLILYAVFQFGICRYPIAHNLKRISAYANNKYAIKSTADLVDMLSEAFFIGPSPDH